MLDVLRQHIPMDDKVRSLQIRLQPPAAVVCRPRMALLTLLLADTTCYPPRCPARLLQESPRRDVQRHL